jgi:spore germination cell wall hydrolase CwlJ-like protein
MIPKAGLTQRDALALTIWAEARNQPLDGQVAVGFVILNRIGSRWKTIKDVVWARLQFSCWNPGTDKNHLRLLEACQWAIRGEIARNDRLVQAYWVADGLLAGFLVNPIGGARHYLNPQALKKLPAWAVASKRSASIGDHDFYSGVA